METEKTFRPPIQRSIYQHISITLLHILLIIIQLSKDRNNIEKISRLIEICSLYIEKVKNEVIPNFFLRIK